MELADEEYKRLVDAVNAAEFHAHSVRQLLALRARVHEVLRIAGLVAEFNLGRASGAVDGANLGSVLSLVPRTEAQMLQDVFCLLLHQGKRDGFFVEFGACDGLFLSNTALLEREFNWRGILGEPSPMFHSDLRKNRSCAIETRCIWSESGKQQEFAEFANDPSRTRSGLLATADDDLVVAQTYKVETVSLADMLRHHGAPPHIDFMSVDTEGSEMEILAPFPFGEFTFGFLSIEHKTPETEAPIKALMERAGYRQILRPVTGGDGFYVPKGFMPKL